MNCVLLFLILFLFKINAQCNVPFTFVKFDNTATTPTVGKTGTAVTFSYGGLGGSGTGSDSPDNAGADKLLFASFVININLFLGKYFFRWIYDL